MATNKYFQSGVPGVFAPQQNLLYDLIEEAISINGVDVYYVPRSLVSVDFVFTEDTLSKFESAFPIEMYLENTQGYDGDASLLTKFGVEIRQSCSFTVSRRRWEEVIGSTGKSLLSHRPTEGDILYFPLTQSMFEITKVVHDNPFYQMGKLFTYRLDCELYQNTSERFSTGISEIDSLEHVYSISESENGLYSEDMILLADEDGCMLVNEDFLDPMNASAQNNVFKTEAAKILDFNPANPFGAF